MASKTTKIQVLHSNFPIVPSLDKLDEGVIAINNRKDKEKIYFRGEVDESGTTRIVEFDPTSTIMKLVDQKYKILILVIYKTKLILLMAVIMLMGHLHMLIKFWKIN